MTNLFHVTTAYLFATERHGPRMMARCDAEDLQGILYALEYRALLDGLDQAKVEEAHDLVSSFLAS